MPNNNLQLYQRSKLSIWTDDHISGNLLTAHLDLNHDAASRNIRTIENTVEWIAGEIKAGARILDLGCGPGLYDILLAKKGFSITGIDISKRSINYAKSQANKQNLEIEYHCLDYLSDNIEGQYDVAMCIYCDFGALIPNEQEGLLKKIHGLLTNSGVFIFDVFKSGICDTKKECLDRQKQPENGFWNKRPCLVLHEVKHFKDHSAWGTRIIVQEHGREPREYIIWDQYYTEKTIADLLESCGFKVVGYNHNLVTETDFTSNDVMFVKVVK